jgi:hypothetical protein
MTDIPINPVTRRVQFTGNTGTGPFAFTFNIFVSSDIAVYKNSTLLTLTTDYTVTIAGDGTGSVTLTGSGSGTAVILADVLTIVGARDLSRTTDFVTAGDLRAITLNEQLDSGVIMAQQLDEKSDRALKFDQFDVYGDATLPVKASRLGAVLAFNATTGNPEAGPTIADVATLAAITADIATLADIQDGTVATDAITNVNTIRTNVTTVAGISANVTTVAGISADITTVVTNIVDIQNAEANADAAIAAKDDAVTAQVAAESAQAGAEAALDAFTDTYLGAFATDPTLDNDGNALTVGDLYFNTTSNVLKVYNGSAWQAAALDASSFLAAANNLSDLASDATARTNLGLGTAATTAATAYATAAQGTLADSALQSGDIGVTVQAYDADTAKLDVAQSFTAKQTFAGSASVASMKTSNIAEVDTIEATAATGTINYDVTTQSVLFYTTDASGNWTLNLRGSSGTSLDTLMATGESLSVTFLVTQGATAYYNSAVTIDGSSVTPKWQGGTAPTSGNASSVDCYTYVIQKTGAATYVVLASQTQFA